MCVCVCVCVCVCIYIYIYIYIQIVTACQVHVNFRAMVVNTDTIRKITSEKECVRICVHARVYVHSFFYLYACVCVCVRPHTCSYPHSCTNERTVIITTCIHMKTVLVFKIFWSTLKYSLESRVSLGTIKQHGSVKHVTLK